MKRCIPLFLTLLVISFVGCGQIGSDYVEDVGSPGAQNAVKKAHQMTDLEFVPVDTLYANRRKTYCPNQKYKGMVYSSVFETNTFVGIDVSFHTFMTALNNSRSVLYTEHLNQPPYHGRRVGLGAYYGTVCSGFVSYALGFNAYQTTDDIHVADFMTLVEDQSAKGIRLADVLWQKGHVALITGIRRRKSDGEIVWIEISEAWRTGCRRRVEKGEEAFNKMLSEGKWKIYRYKNLEQNGYKPMTEFVAVEGETRTPFQFNNSICPNKGDKSCYVTGETVVLNMAGGKKKLEIYKDSELYKKLDVGEDLDVELKDLPYGDYKARLVEKNGKSDFACWKVVDVQVDADREKDVVSFHSDNATPVYLEFCTVSGMPLMAWHLLTEKDIANGFVKISALPFSDKLKKKKSDLYVKVHFKCEYGRVINRPVLWKKTMNVNNEK